MKLSLRLCLLAAVALGAVLVTSVEGLMTLRSSLMDERRETLARLSDTAFSTVAHYESLAREGRLELAEAKRLAAEAVGALRYGEVGYFWIQDRDLKMVMHPIKPSLDGQSLGDFEDAQGKRLFIEMESVISTQGAGFVEYHWAKPGSEVPEAKVSFVRGFAPWQWVIGTGVYVSDLHVMDAFWAQAGKSIAFIAVAAIVLIAGCVLISRGIVRRLGGEPATLATVVTRISAGDLSSEIPLTRGDTSSVTYLIHRMQADLREMIGAMRRQSEAILNATRQVAEASATVRESSAQQADAAQSTAAAVEEIVDSVNVVASSTDASREDSERTSREAEAGEEQSRLASESIANVEHTVVDAAAQIQVLKERSSEIGSIAQVIREIADQTNLLALNAAIEAALAGEQGRGFAVVADEVRSLAERTGSATAQISDVIEAVQQDTSTAVASIEAITPKVKQGSDLASQSAKLLHSIQNSADGTRARVNEVADSMQALSVGASGIASNMSAINELTHRSLEAIERNADATSTLSRTADELQALIGRFKT